MHYLRFRVLCRGRSVCNELPAGYIYILARTPRAVPPTGRAHVTRSRARSQNYYWIAAAFTLYEYEKGLRHLGGKLGP